MQNLHYIALESMNLAPSGGAVTDIIASVHRFIASYPDQRIQLSFPQAVIEGMNKQLGRRAVIFGSKPALDAFWARNQEDIEQSCIVAGTKGMAVRSLDKLMRNQPEAILGYARFSRLRVPNKATLLARKREYLESKGFEPDEAELEAWAEKRRQTLRNITEEVTYFSKTTQDKVILKVVVTKDDSASLRFEESKINGFGLSAKNILPILKF